MRDKLPEMAEKLGISLSQRQVAQFHDYYDLLISWNRKMNLTTVTDYEDVVTRHFVDSLAVIQAVDLTCGEKLSLLDVGTGAGFPGIPLKIAFPGLKVTLVEARQKRISFLEDVIQRLKLTDIAEVHGRAEDLAGQKQGDNSGTGSPMRESFDLCVSRAVARLSVLAEYCLPFVEVGGCFLAYKSEEVDEELKDAENAVSILGGEVETVLRYTLPETDIHRSIIKIKKVNRTDEKYPRRAGKPEKSPL